MGAGKSRSPGLRWSIFAVAVATAGCTTPETMMEGVREAPAWLAGPLLSLGTLVSEDLACVTGGILASQGAMPLVEVVFWCWLGILGGDVGLYGLGRLFGEKVAAIPLLQRGAGPERLRSGERLFRKHGGWVLVTSRFLPGTRVPVYLAAGVVKYSLAKFALFLALAGVVWTPLIVGFAHWGGGYVLEWLDLYERFAWVGIIVAALLLWIGLKGILPLFTYRGRSLLLSRWLRFREWEFWPWWMVYLPVFVQVARLGRRHGGLTTFTAANPGIPHGGVVLESKSAILNALSGGAGRDDRIAKWRVLAPDVPMEERLQDLESFQASAAVGYPLVLKPDVGERGQGVAIVRSGEEVETFLRACPDPVIAQEFVPGLEFGVFYVRHPQEEEGRILSLTQKHTLSVEGDGRFTLERLILRDPRGLRNARYFLARHEARLDEVPPMGEEIALGELGTHCRGALFLDARGFATEALTGALDGLARQFEGFHFGRFDLKVPDVEALREGRDFKVLELNGVCSEVTHIYQPGYSLFRAWRDLAGQWGLAFEIGAFNREAGHPVTPGKDLRALLRDARSRPAFEAPPAPDARREEEEGSPGDSPAFHH